MADDPMDELARRLKATKPPAKVSKAQRTLMFAEPNFTTLQRYCRTKGLAVGDVIDDLIATLLAKIADDLPPEG